MKINQIHIENFRSIKDATIRLHELTALVGENNSGKTGILRALNCFLTMNLKKLTSKILLIDILQEQKQRLQ